jgi:TatD DNase family protein
VFASVGIDPDLLIPGNKSFAENIQKPTSYWEEQIESLRKLISENKNYVVAIGETGMDAYWLEREMKEGKVDFATTKKSIQVQEELFRMHLQLASEVDLPLSIHSRAAEPACLEIIGNFSAARISGVFHSYTGDYETAVKILDAGWALGVNGIITFKNAEDLREMYRKIIGKVTSDLTPADLYSKGIYLETDAPYLAPEGKRGERNNPGNVSQIFTDFIEALKK